MAMFKDLESYAAYCGLVNACWREIDALEKPKNTFLPIAKEFVRLIIKRSASCAPDQALRWCRLLRMEPWEHYMEGNWNSFLKCYTPRIQDCLQNSSSVSASDPTPWIEFVAEHAENDGENTKQWAWNCLCVVKDVAIPGHVAAQALAVLLRIAPSERQKICTEVWRLEDLISDERDDLWPQPAFREALLYCLSGQNRRDECIRECLGGLLELNIGDPDKYRNWMDCYNALQKLNVCLEGAHSASASIPASSDGAPGG